MGPKAGPRVFEKRWVSRVPEIETRVVQKVAYFVGDEVKRGLYSALRRPNIAHFEILFLN